MTARPYPSEAVADATGLFPGATAVSRVRIYDWATPDGLHGGSAHVHLVCTESYVVLGGRGRLQTLGPDGYEERPLRPYDVVWFTPGVIHRAVNEGGLDILVVMQNSGLPEAGDAVLVMPPAILADPDRYAEAVSLATPDRIHATDEAAARRRRDLAIEGFLELRDRVAAEGAEALDDFYAAARRIVEPRLSAWEERWRDGPLAAAEQTGRHLAALRRGDLDHLHRGGVTAIAPPDDDKLGMCGRITPYEP